MSLLEDLTEELAKGVFEIELVERDPQLAQDIARSLGDSSTIMEEAFLTNMRYLRAAQRARDIIERHSST